MTPFERGVAEAVHIRFSCNEKNTTNCNSKLEYFCSLFPDIRKKRCKKEEDDEKEALSTKIK